MKNFVYIVTSADGKKEKGNIFASSKEEAVQKLKQDKKYVLGVVEQQRPYRRFFNQPSLRFEEKLIVIKHLAIMLTAGITLSGAFSILVDQMPGGANKKMFESILKMISSGETLARSLAQYPKIFSEIYVNMIGIGEQSGNLSETLTYLDKQMEKENDLRKKVLGAFIYPALIITITLLLTLGIVLFIMPKIIKIFESFEVELPLPTRILIGASQLMTERPLYTLAGVILIVTLAVTLLKNKSLRPLWYAFLLHAPLFGKLFIKISLARFFRTMNSLLKSGVPVTQALEVTSRMYTNPHYKNAVFEARNKVEQGSTLYEALHWKAKLFPDLAVKMINVGEKTGKLEKITQHLARFYEHEVDNITKNLAVLVEPLLLVFMAMLVGGVALSIILPIYQLPNLIQR